ncbi:hypothetical protein [Haloarchaeobius sp. TZWWS8]|uniref:hypothetical protein n=1 Tax=Haloarchaeobius sp. TZWWS8 TaxID=3446121 RepID=UPI003EBDEACE
MTSQWIEVDETGSGTVEDPFRPAIDSSQNFSGVHDKANGKFIVRVDDPDSDGTSLQSESMSVSSSSGAVSLTDGEAAERLNSVLGEDREPSEWNDSYSTGK